MFVKNRFCHFRTFPWLLKKKCKIKTNLSEIRKALPPSPFCHCYYGFGLSLDTRDSNAYVSHAKRTRCYAKTATLPRANFSVWSYGYLRSSTNRKRFHAFCYVVQHDVCCKNKITKPRSWAAYDQTKKFALGNVVVSVQQRVHFKRETYAFESRVSKLNPKP